MQRRGFTLIELLGEDGREGTADDLALVRRRG